TRRGAVEPPEAVEARLRRAVLPSRVRARAAWTGLRPRTATLRRAQGLPRSAGAFLRARSGAGGGPYRPRRAVLALRTLGGMMLVARHGSRACSSRQRTSAIIAAP